MIRAANGFAALLVFLASGTGVLAQKSDPPQPADIAWLGHGAQDNGTEWSIEVTARADGGVGIAYPSLECGGYLDTLPTGPSGAPRYREVLTYGQAGCIDGGVVELTETPDGRLSYHWYYPEPDGNLGAVGELRRGN